MLSATKHLDPANEILRGIYTGWNECAQDDKRRGEPGEQGTLPPCQRYATRAARAPPPGILTTSAPTRLMLLLAGRYAVLRWLQLLLYGLGDRVLSGTFLILSLHLY